MESNGFGANSFGTLPRRLRQLAPWHQSSSGQLSSESGFPSDTLSSTPNMANNTTNKGKLGKKVTISAPIEEEGSDGADEPGLTADGEQVELDPEKRREAAQRRREQNAEHRAALESVRLTQAISRPWVFSYYVMWPRESYEKKMGTSKQKKVVRSRTGLSSASSTW